jgi:hypothetical protein
VNKLEALDSLLDARVTNHEIALWLEISELVVAERWRQRASAALNRRPTSTLPCTWTHTASQPGPSLSGLPSLTCSTSPGETPCVSN